MMSLFRSSFLLSANLSSIHDTVVYYICSLHTTQIIIYYLGDINIVYTAMRPTTSFKGL